MKRIARIAKIAGIADIAHHRRDRNNQKAKAFNHKGYEEVAPYSQRKEIMGSILAARRAGM